jgi:hypothetical protein
VRFSDIHINRNHTDWDTMALFSKKKTLTGLAKTCG